MNIQSIRRSLGTIEIRLTEEASSSFHRYGAKRIIGELPAEALNLGFELGEYYTESHGRVWFKNK